MEVFLLVDDDAGALTLMDRILKRAFSSCRILHSKTGQDALDTLKVERPDVVVLDVNLPDQSGFDVCRTLRSDPVTAGLPILMVTGERVESSNRVQGLEIGADGYIYKPFLPNEFVAQVKVMLRVKTAEDHLRSQKEELEKAFQEQTVELQHSREALQQKVSELQETLERQTQELIRADRLASVGVLAAGIAHEVNNPNTFIASNLQTFKMFWNDVEAMLAGASAALPPEQARKWAFIREEMPALVKGLEEGTKRIAGIVTGIKGYAAGSSENQRIVDITEIVESALRLAWNQLKHDIEVINHLPADLPKVFGSEQLLVQVFLNLFLNAAHAMKEHRGEGVLTLSGFVNDENMVVVSVADNGPGIRSEDLANLFNPFFTTRREKGGTGLGLFVSHGIIKGHNGRLEVASVVNQGTTFQVVLPMVDRNQSVEVLVEDETAADAEPAAAEHAPAKRT
jgi:signal transduction histidine kinase